MNGALAKLVASWPHSSLSSNSRVHFHEKAKHTAAARQEGFCLVRALPYERQVEIAKLPQILLLLEFLPPNIRVRDEHNLQDSCKALIDGIADGLRVNDSRFRVRPRLTEEVVRAGCVKVYLMPVPRELLEGTAACLL